MYCNKCGTRNTDTAKFCNRCGAALKHRTAAASKTSSGTAPVRSEPRTYGTPGAVHKKYAHSSVSRSLDIGTDKLFWAVVILLIVSFIGIFTPWIKAENSSESESFSFTDICKDDSRFSAADSMDGSIFKDQIDDLNDSRDKMKTAGIIGFIAAGAAVLLAFAAPKKMPVAAVASAVCFGISTAASSSFASALEKIAEKELALSGYADGGTASVGWGLIFSLICTCAASAIAIFGKVSSDRI